MKALFLVLTMLFCTFQAEMIYAQTNSDDEDAHLGHIPRNQRHRYDRYYNTRNNGRTYRNHYHYRGNNRPHYPRRTYNPAPRYPQTPRHHTGNWRRWRTNAYEGQVFTTNGITYIAHRGYAHKYSSHQQCTYGLVNSRTWKTIYVFGRTSCRHGYNLCADMRRRYNYGNNNHFCGVK